MTYLIGQLQRRVEFYSGILLIGSGPGLLTAPGVMDQDCDLEGPPNAADLSLSFGSGRRKWEDELGSNFHENSADYGFNHYQSVT